jgi:ribonuclease HI
MNIEIWTDGSSRDNGKPHCVGGWSACYMMGRKIYIRYGHLPAPSSNNRGEIWGVLYSIMTFLHKPEWKLHIYSDSQYVCKSINEWRHKWKKNNYDGVTNSDLLIPLFEAWDKHGNASISWVKGHAGIRGNELADEFASAGSKNVDRAMKTDFVDIVKIEEIKYARIS